MMREEFENLTGLTISLHYYESLIEPEYIETNIDKQEFCAQWLKSHKSAICKALDVDMSRMMREDAVRVFKVAEHDRISKLLKERTQEQQNLETDVHNLKTDLSVYGETISKLIDERDNLKETLAALESNHREMLDANEAYEKAFASKDAEIMKLKAMLFDMMYKTA